MSVESRQPNSSAGLSVPPEERPGLTDSAPSSPVALSPESDNSGALLSTLHRMWDVNTDEVVYRCKLALYPHIRTPFHTNGLLDAECNAALNSIVNGKQPDLWGPVWIFLTMVFAVFFSATTLGLLNGMLVSYSASLLAVTTSALFAFTFLVPLCAWFVIRYLDLIPSLTLLQTVCLYGYSCTSWIPAMVVVGSPLGADAVVGGTVANLVRGLAITAAFFVSARFVYGNLYRVMSAQALRRVAFNKTRMKMVLVAGVLVHAALAITVLLLTMFASEFD